MRKERLEAFSDGVIAVIITISVLEMKVPHGASLEALAEVAPIFLTYAVSYTYVGIYWNNHHHLLQSTESIDGKVMWANLHLLFWLSLLPFATGWMGENHFERVPTMLYGLDLLLCGIAYLVLEYTLIRHQGGRSLLARAVGRDLKGMISAVLYIVGIATAAFAAPWLAQVFFVAPAVLWFIPDRRLERRLARHEEK